MSHVLRLVLGNVVVVRRHTRGGPIDCGEVVGRVGPGFRVSALQSDCFELGLRAGVLM